MFSTTTDIANRAADHLGAPRISSLSENSKAALYFTSIYDKLRQSEFQAHAWRFTIRSAALRPISATTKLMSFPTWAAGTTYQKGDIVNDTTANVGNSGKALYISLIAANLANIPSSATQYVQTWAPYFGPDCGDAHSLSNTYSVGELVWITTVAHINLANGEINHTPPGTGTWAAAGLTGVTVDTLFIPWPITQVNAGTSRSLYRLPFGYLRPAPQDPKIAGGSFQSVGAGMQWSDFQFLGNYLLTSTPPSPQISAGPLLFRFVADITDVTMFEPLFCELLAARMAYDTCEAITQKPQLKRDIAGRYDELVMRAQHENMIELGSTDPKEEQFLLSRIPSNPDQQDQKQQQQGR